MTHSLSSNIVDLLTSGGDERIIANQKTGLNIYGCPIIPNENIAFSSSTASSISKEAFEYVKNLQNGLIAQLKYRTAKEIYREQIKNSREKLAKLLRLSQTNKPDIIFAPSGTDLHLYISTLYAQTLGKPLSIISLNNSETGSGVEMASCGKYYQNSSPKTKATKKGEYVFLGNDIENIAINVRDNNGALLSLENIENNIIKIAEDAINQGRHCLLFVTDVSKTGLIAPPWAIAEKIQKQFMGDFDIIIDACQFRISNDKINYYLSKNYMVALTGSKFFAGPVFSGMLLVPNLLANIMKYCKIPYELCHFANIYEWPDGWLAQNFLQDDTNFGLLFRINAALFEIKKYLLLDADKVLEIKTNFYNKICAYINDSNCLEILEVWQNDNDIPTIITFVLRDDRQNAKLNAAQTREIFTNLLNENIYLGQPVNIGNDTHNNQLSALRICLSAPNIYFASQNKQNFDELINQAIFALKRIEELAIEASNYPIISQIAQ